MNNNNQLINQNNNNMPIINNREMQNNHNFDNNKFIDQNLENNNIIYLDPRDEIALYFNFKSDKQINLSIIDFNH